jgi:putative membrane protein
MEASDYYIMASALMVSLDLSFDPVFSNSLGLWTWQGQTQYFGVPFSNFFGWFIASLTFFAVFYFASKRRTKSSKYAIAFYYLFGLDNVVGDLASGSLALGIASLLIFTLSVAIIIFVHRKNEARIPSAGVSGVPQISAVSR